MTGRYAMRYGLQTVVIFLSHTYGLPTDERTLPQALKEAGYQTYMVGNGTSAMPTKSIGRKIAGSITSTATSLAKWTTSPVNAAG